MSQPVMRASDLLRFLLANGGEEAVRRVKEEFQKKGSVYPAWEDVRERNPELEGVTLMETQEAVDALLDAPDDPEGFVKVMVERSNRPESWSPVRLIDDLRPPKRVEPQWSPWLL